MNDLISFENMSDREMQLIQDKLTAARMEALSGRMVKIEEKIEIAKADNENLREIEIARHRAEENRFGFVSLNDLGQMYDVSIGSKTMGKLLRIVGLAKAKQSKTEPLRSAITSNYAKSQMYGDHVTYQWNPEKCIKKVDEWLNDNNLIDKFYAFDNEEGLKTYINDLERHYGV